MASPLVDDPLTRDVPLHTDFTAFTDAHATPTESPHQPSRWRRGALELIDDALERLADRPEPSLDLLDPGIRSQRVLQLFAVLQKLRRQLVKGLNELVHVPPPCQRASRHAA